MDMDKGIKAGLITALRSGHYKQGTGALKNGDSYCCLGVLSDLYIRETGQGEWMPSDAFRYPGVWDSTGLPPSSVCGWANIERHGHIELGEYSFRNECGTRVTDLYLTELNDMGFTFDQIADLIEFFM